MANGLGRGNRSQPDALVHNIAPTTLHVRQTAAKQGRVIAPPPRLRLCPCSRTLADTVATTS